MVTVGAIKDARDRARRGRRGVRLTVQQRADAVRLPVVAADQRRARHLSGIPMTRVENACASGFGRGAPRDSGDPVRARRHRAGGRCGEDDPRRRRAGWRAPCSEPDAELAGTQSPAGFAGIFAEVAQQYRERYDAQHWLGDTLGRIAAKNHLNGCANPWAQLRKDLGMEFCSTVSERNPVVAEPLRRTDCSLVSDGAAALVLRKNPQRSDGYHPWVRACQ